MSEQASSAAQLSQLAHEVIKEGDQDIYVYSGGIEPPQDDVVFEHCFARARKPNVLLILSTYGGDPNSAYRIARYFQEHYRRFTVLVSGFCKSAGTLVVIGAKQLVMLEQAELGPLDVQLRKDDDFAERSSGLAPVHALTVLEDRALAAFRKSFFDLRINLLLTSKTAAEIAGTLATGIYGPILAQMDPMRIGEIDRANRIAVEYGNRLNANSGNLKDHGLAQLMAGYPAHGFVNDRAEAKRIFNNVREPTPAERRLVDAIKPVLRRPVDTGDGPISMYLEDESRADQEAATDARGNAAPNGKAPEGRGGGNVVPLSPHGESGSGE